MAFIDCSINSPKLVMLAEPWDSNSMAMKDLATLSPYVDSLNCGFSVFLKHPSEVGKKIKTKNGQKDLSNMPIQCRMDRIRFTLFMNAIVRLVEDPEYAGKELKCLNYWYDDNGEVILTDGKKKPCHTSTAVCARDEHGRIFIGIREEKHPHKDTGRPSAKFVFQSGYWFKNCSPTNGSELSKAEDSKETALAFVENWKDAVFKCLDKNYEIFIKEKAERKKKLNSY